MTRQEVADRLRIWAETMPLMPAERPIMREAANMLENPPGFIEVDAADLPRDAFRRVMGLDCAQSCESCGGSRIQEVYGGHGTVLEVPCSDCPPRNNDHEDDGA